MADKIKSLIIDDEAPARELISKFLEKIPYVEVLGECENGFEAMKMIQELKPDLLFLDIQMPKISGFELLEILDPCPEIIFTTAFEQFALKAFEMNAVDYLLKPFSFNRFGKAVDKVRQRINSADPVSPAINNLRSNLELEKKQIDRIIARQGSKIIVIATEQLDYIEAQDDYVMIHSETGNYLKEKTMKYYEEHLPEGHFIRIHRSYIVSLSSIVSVELYAKDTHLVILKNGEKLKCSREGYKRLREIF